MNSKKIRAAIIGCGRMGLHHAKAIGVCADSELVGVADRFVDVNAIRAALPSGTPIYQDPVAMLRELRPDVVHVVTPPDTHGDMARLALELGVHVYVEKPFTLTSDAAREIVELARQKGLKVCAGHQVLFQHTGQQYRRYLPVIGKVVHIESYFSFKTVRRVGGGLMSPAEQLADILPHPVYLMLDALDAADPASASASCELVALDVDADGDIRALLKRGGIPAMLTVTLRGRPIESYLRIVAVNGSLWVDFVLSGITRLLGPGASVISAVFNPFIRARQIMVGTVANLYRMIRRKHKSYAGLAELIEAFHRTIANNAPSPVAPSAIVETVRLCELIGARTEQVAKAAEAAAIERLAQAEAKLSAPNRTGGTVLVTGGAGFLGRATVAALRNHGWPVRVVARRLPSAAARVPGVDYMLGDVSKPLPDSIYQGVGLIVHLAAETRGGKEDHQRNTIDATRHVLDAAARHGIKRFIHTSSIAVLRPSTATSGPLKEDSPVDADNLGRGPYVWAKAETERMVTDFCRAHGMVERQIRLGPLVDFANFTPPGRLGREVGPLFVAMGLPNGKLSVCDVGTAANVIRHFVEAFESAPPMLNLVEAKQPTRGDLVSRLRHARPDLKVMWLPLPVVWVLALFLKVALRTLSPRKKPLDLYAAFTSERYDNALAAQVIAAAGSPTAAAVDSRAAA